MGGVSSGQNSSFGIELVAEWRRLLLVEGRSCKEIAREESAKLGRSVSHNTVVRRLEAEYPEEMKQWRDARPVPEPVEKVPARPAGVNSHVMEAGDPISWGALLALTPSLSDLYETPYYEVHRETR